MLQLGIPTANIPPPEMSAVLDSGIYYGFAGVSITSRGELVPPGAGRGGVWPMVMSVGWNPFYKNTVRSIVCR